MSSLEASLLLFGAAVLAGAVNSIAGGGTLLSFPMALAAGLPSPIANATNAVAMCPGSLASAWAYRRELRPARALAGRLLPPTIVGAAIGALLMRWTSERAFDAIVPWLVLGATLAILLQEAMGRALARRADHSREASGPGERSGSRFRRWGAVACQLLVGVYGGYFGAAMGIVMLAVLSLVADGNIHAKNAVKNLLSAVANGVAALLFALSDLVDGRAALLMVPGAILGGFLGANLARRAPARAVRALVVAIGLSLSALLGYRAYLGG
jgi:uncharacterized protein